MQKLYDEVGSLDKRCRDEFFLNDDILMEHAATGIANFIRLNFTKKSKIIIACGSGNNGADGLALARLLHIDYDVSLFQIKKPNSTMAQLQEKRNSSLDIKTTKELSNCDVLVDSVVGTGFKGFFDETMKPIMKRLNDSKAFKIACDIPSGINIHGVCTQETFMADITLTMGALKKNLFLDEAKDFVGEVKVLDLGVARKIYETPSNWNLLDLDDMQLPFRNQKNSNKGNFGHLAIPCGDKTGAAIISGLAALRFGSGLVTLLENEKAKPLNIPHALMLSRFLPANVTAIACGMGLGIDFNNEDLKKILDNSLPLLIDADFFYKKIILEVLTRNCIVITPHPKEFVSLLRIIDIADITVNELQKNRFFYAQEFCAAYPNVTLVLKGANVIIGESDAFFINPHGTSVLAKGGTGDVLSGLIGSLLAQGWSPLDAAINASLAHTKLALNYVGSDFSLTPDDLIEGIGNL